MGLGLGKGTLRDATLEVLAEEDTLVGEDAAGGEGRLGADVQPLGGERESATTMWKNAKFFLPWRWSLILTAIVNLF